VSGEADVAIVGLGAAGAVAAHVLTAAGLDVVALEAGPRVDASMMTLDEVRNDIRNWLSAPKSWREIPTWRANESEAAAESPWPTLMVNAVGGTTIHYNCVSIRFHPWHFEARTRTIERYGEAAIPDGATLADWPFGYDELEPYYDLVEHAVGVSGAAGANVHEAPRSRGYPMPPLRASGWGTMLSDAAQRLGWHPFPAPAAINTEPYGGRPACTYCGFCTCNGCYTNAKGSTDLTLLPAAAATGRLRVESGARVVRVDVDGDGTATGVTFVRDGREHVQRARMVVLAGFVYENTRLLLLSRSRAFPDGLANNAGQVGRHYTAHVTPFSFGLFPGLDLGRFNGAAGGQATCVDDWNGDVFDHRGAGFVGGAMLMALQELKPIESVRDRLPPGVPRWGAEWKAWIREHARSIGTISAQIDALTYEHNYLDLDPVARDSFGLPRVRVTHRVGENELRAWEFMREKLELWLSEAGAAQTWTNDPVFIEARHAYGGTRMGADPASSVVDGFGIAHEVPNLAVLGASTFPTAGGHNPTLTLQAAAWRSAERIAALLA
jgi:gluconate 2-dehydrogenase alpha chain